MVYVMSDLHGYSLNKIKNAFEKVNFSDDDYCFILGDVIDRGDEGIDILKWLISQTNIQLVLGNHEAMMLSCGFLFDEITDENLDNLNEEDMEVFTSWVENGAETTLKQLSELDPETVLAIIEYLKDAPLYESVNVNGKDYLLTHSGLGNFDVEKHINDYTPEEFLWNRPKKYDKYYPDIMTVFGHTPTFFFGNEYRGKVMFTDTWIDIDTGAAYGEHPVLFRLDDKKVFYV